MARRKKHEEHENHERWLVSYADFITLLFAFFVVMYSVSSVNEGKYRVLSKTLSYAFNTNITSSSGGPYRQLIQLGRITETKGGPPSSGPVSIDILKSTKLSGGGQDKRPGSTARGPQGQIGPSAAQMMADKKGPSKTGEQIAAAVAALKKVAGQIENAMEPLVKQGMVQIRQDEYFIEVEISSSILFVSGSAQLSRTAIPVLTRIADITKQFPNPVRVEGYTDNMPINIDLFPSNWELSTGRASSVVRMLVSKGIMPTRLSAIGYGEFRPVADNLTEEGRRRNRRVVLVIQAGEDVDTVVEKTNSKIREIQGKAVDGLFTPEPEKPVANEEKESPQQSPTMKIPEGIVVKKDITAPVDEQTKTDISTVLPDKAVTHEPSFGPGPRKEKMIAIPFVPEIKEGKSQVTAIVPEGRRAVTPSIMRNIESVPPVIELPIMINIAPRIEIIPNKINIGGQKKKE